MPKRPTPPTEDELPAEPELDEESPQDPPRTELERVIAERDEALENSLRARADYQNLRRRLQTDIDLAVEGRREELLSELLLVLDYLDMALSTECATDEGKNLLLGVQLTRQQLVQFLEHQGVTAISSEGAFDPALHQAIEMVAAGDREPGQVVETVRGGYRIGERVLRHAQVKVAADPADPAPGASTDAD